jgi:uncharacterized membrane protein
MEYYSGVMTLYFIVKTIHIVSATILFGTGLGTAFFMLCSRYAEDVGEKLFVARTVVWADYLFTLPAVIVQPLTGFWLISHGGFSWTAPWLMGTYIIYIIAGLCWLPVVWIQIRLKQILVHSHKSGETLPTLYYRLFRIWFLLGWPAFIGLVAVFFLMVMKSA